MKCPKCSEATLAAKTIDFVEVDTCPACEGIWFDRAELGELLRRDDQRVEAILGGEDEADLDKKRGACPRDGQRLLRVKSSRNRDVVLDTCVRCQGLWLDGGEFARIKQAEPGINLGDLI